MGPVENLTPYGFAFLPNVDRAGHEILLMAVAAHFELPRPGRVHAGPLVPCEEQPPPHFDDVHWGEPASTGLRYEGQSAFDRPGTDIYVNGSAHAPGGQPVQHMQVEVVVGPCREQALVIGDRVWVETAGTITASPPVPFHSMPLRWARAFGGGPAQGEGGYEARNPVGVGLHASAEAASGAPLPNIEDPRDPVREPWSRPRPVGFGPIGRHWHPRVSLAGTYDERWKRERAPLWADDLDEHFFLAAAPPLRAVPHLAGGESVLLSGLHPAGGFGFRLPTLRLSCKSALRGGTQRVAMRLDAVILETDEARISLVYRAAVGVGRSGGAHRYSILRELEAWESPPAQVYRGDAQGGPS